MLKRAFSRLILLALIILGGLILYFYFTSDASPSVQSSITDTRPPERVQAAQLINAPRDAGSKPAREMETVDENDVFRSIPLSQIPGGGVVLSKQVLVIAPIGSEGLADLIVDGKLSDEKKAEALAHVAMNQQEDPEVRQEALDQWLRFIPEEGEALLSSLAKDSRVTNEMAAVLIKDTFTRTVSIQAEVALILFSHKEPEIRQLAREQLVALTGIDHKDNPNAWSAEIKNLLSRQPKN